MSWVCEMCSTNNDDSSKKCFVCGSIRPAEICEYEKIKPKRAEGACKTEAVAPPKVKRGVKPRRVARVSRSLARDLYAPSVIAAIFVALCFIVGQVLQYVNFGLNDKVFLLSELLTVSGNNDFFTLLFLIFTSAIGLFATGITALVCYLSFSVKKFSPFLQNAIIICLGMLVIPSFFAIPALIFSVLLLAYRDRIKVIKTIAGVFIGIAAFSLFGVSVFVSAVRTALQIQYYIELNFNGGEGETRSIAVYYGGDLSGASAPICTGYTFDGFFDSEEGGEMYIDSNMTGVKTWDKLRGGVLYARWIPNTYTVTFDKKGGVGGADVVTATYGEPLPQDLGAPEREGYEFVGYMLRDNDGKLIEVYYDRNMRPRVPWNIPEDAVLTAAWNVKIMRIKAEPDDLLNVDAKGQSVYITVYAGSGKYSDLEVVYADESVSYTLENNVLTLKKTVGGAVGYIKIEVKDLVTKFVASVIVYFSTAY